MMLGGLVVSGIHSHNDIFSYNNKFSGQGGKIRRSHQKEFNLP